MELTNLSLRSGFVLFVILFGSLLGAAEVGHRVAYRRRLEVGDAERAHSLAIQGAILGLLALLLGFTFSLSVERYDARRLLVVDEANAIGTAYLRTALVPSPTREVLQAQLRTYVRLRSDAFGETLDVTGLASLERRSQELLSSLWREASAVSIADPHSVAAGLLVQSINAVVDLHAARMAARQARVPSIVVLLLSLVAWVALCWVGVGEGLAGRRRTAGRAVLAGLVAATLVLTLDIDRPTSGWVRVSQEPMRSLADSMTPPGMDQQQP